MRHRPALGAAFGTAALIAVMAVAAGVAISSRAAAASAATELADTVNWVRQRGCGSGTQRPALIENAKLVSAARRIGKGTALHDALMSEGYVATQSSELHLSGAVNDAQVSNLLRASYCRTLTDPSFREIGVQRSGAEVWIVIAAPVSIPSQADAGGAAKRVLELTNAARAAGRRCGSKSFPPAPPLTLNASLTAAALSHSREMARYSEFEHRGHDGSNPAGRVQEAGYGAYKIVGENIAAGAMSAAEATQGWLSSPPHCENIMDPRFTEMGVGFASNIKDANAMYWTQDFAAKR